MDQAVTDWLLEAGNAAVRYRTSVDLLGEPADAPSAATARAQIGSMPEVVELFGRRSDNGLWQVVDPKTKDAIRDPLHEKNIYFTSTAFQYVAEFGLDASDCRVSESTESLLSLLGEMEELDREAPLLEPCKYPQFVRPLVMLGYRDHPVVQRLVDHLVDSIRWDNGYLCDRKEHKRKTGTVKSCVLATQTALLAVSSLPELWDVEACQRLVEYFLRRKVLRRTDRPEELVHRHISRTEFPFRFGGLVGILFSLSRLGYGSRKELAAAWGVLANKSLPNGRYAVDWTNTYSTDPCNRLPSLGRRHHENKWVTFYACLAKKLAGLA